MVEELMAQDGWEWQQTNSSCYTHWE